MFETEEELRMACLREVAHIPMVFDRIEAAQALYQFVKAGSAIGYGASADEVAPSSRRTGVGH
jgi:hypothetical protein